MAIDVPTLTPSQIPDYIRTALYGVQVREALAQACQYVSTVYSDAVKTTDVATVAETKNYLGIE